MIIRGAEPYSRRYPFKKGLMQRVFAYAAATEAQGLVAEFGRRFRGAVTAVDTGQSGMFTRLESFMKAVANPPPIDEAGLSDMHHLIMLMNDGQPQAVRALNVIAVRDEKLVGGMGWRDASSDPPGNNSSGNNPAL